MTTSQEGQIDEILLDYCDKENCSESHDHKILKVVVKERLQKLFTALTQVSKESFNRGKKEGEIAQCIALDDNMISDLKNAKVGDTAYELIQSIQKEAEDRGYKKGWEECSDDVDTKLRIYRNT